MINNFYYKKHKVIKNLGQHFIDDIYIINLIISSINPKKNQNIIEIGPGLGSLTKPLLSITNRIIAIEIDKNLINFLNKNLNYKKNLTLINNNVMKINFFNLSKKFGKPIRIFGNLPYNISTTLIIYLMKYNLIIKDMHFMLQKELFNRIIAIPNNKYYCRLSIITQYFFKIIKILEVPSFYFKPKPKVDSIFVRLIPNKKPILKVHNIKNLFFLTQLSFKNRRKMLRNSLSKIFNIKEFIELGINSKLRAEDLSIKEYCKLSNHKNLINFNKI
ncbi:MAG: 16S rRNA (adenine(1518)-N(6)/adenine(1519)-N(6))-dimethyltransferase RsmA [Enterobacterales bacterium]